MRRFSLSQDRAIGTGQPTFVIAEVGINHDGDFDTAMWLVEAAAKAGADAVKLQTYTTEKRVPKDSPVYDILKRCELSYRDQEKLFDAGRALGLEMFSTPFDDEAVAFLDDAGCRLFKVASFDSVNRALLRAIAATGKPVILSTGMTDAAELEAALAILPADKTAVLHCVSSYPLAPENADLAAIRTLHEMHNGPVGYSDHTTGIEVPVLAVAGGATVIEKHFTLDTNADGPDHALSADPQTMAELVSGIRRVETILGEPALRQRDAESGIVPFRRPSA